MIGRKKDFTAYPLARLGEQVTRIRSEDELDSMGGKLGVEEEEIQVTVIFANINAKDMKIHEMGLAVIGDMKVYFDDDQDIIEGDTLLRGTTRWHVDKITAQYNGIYSVALLKNMSLKGS